MRQVIYLATPYSYKTKSKEIGANKPDFEEINQRVMKERFEKVSEVAAKLFKAGFFVFSPISMSVPIAKHLKDTDDFSFWEDFDYTMITKCGMVMVLCIDGWKESEGVAKEINFAASKEIPVMFISEDLKRLGV